MMPALETFNIERAVSEPGKGFGTSSLLNTWHAGSKGVGLRVSVGVLVGVKVCVAVGVAVGE